MLDFEWNTILLILIALLGSGCTLLFNHYYHKSFRSLIRLGIVIVFASIAACVALKIKPDVFGVLLVRALIIEFVAIYALREDRMGKIIG